MLVLALVYIVAVSLTVGALADWAMNDLNNTGKFESAQVLQTAASNATELAIQSIRYTPLLTTTVGNVSYCWGNGPVSQLATTSEVKGVSTTTTMDVWCETTWTPLSSVSRTVYLYTCLAGVSGPACQSNPFLSAVVDFDDYPAGATSAPIQGPCSVYCGQGITVVSWTWGSSSNSSIAGVAALATFSLEPSSTTVGAVTSAAVTVTDASGKPVVNDAVTITVSGGGTLDSSSSLVETTNTSGVATFTNLVLDTAGQFTLTASVTTNNPTTPLTATSTSFTVGKGANSITITSTAPTNAYVGGPTYTPSASAISRDQVAIGTSTTGICTASNGIVSFISAGTCTVTFTDNGNQNYLAASPNPVTQSFHVYLHPSVIAVKTSAPTSAVVNGATYTPTATSTSGDTVTITVDSSSTAVCSIASGVVSFQAVGTCELDFNDPGNTNYAAATQVQQSFSVGKGANTITITSSETGAVVGGTYTPTATASSGDAVEITVDTSSSSICSMASGVVTFNAAGTCELDFNDPGNANYVAANLVQQKITVTTPAPTGVNISTVSNGNGKPGSGDEVLFTYSQVMSASSLKSGFTGSSTAVDVQLSRAFGSTSLAVYTSTNGTTPVNLGVVSLGDTGFSHYLGSFTTVYFSATMTMATVSGQSVVTVTLGSEVGTTTINTVSGTTTLTWTPSASATNTSGTPCSTGNVTEANAPAQNF